MNKYDVERAIIANRPGEPFVLVQNVDGDELDNLDALDWQADTAPPTWKEASAWATDAAVTDGRTATAAAIRARLAESDLWAVRHVEDGVSLTPERIAYRQQLRDLLAGAETMDAAAVETFTLPDAPTALAAGTPQPLPSSAKVAEAAAATVNVSAQALAPATSAAERATVVEQAQQAAMDKLTA